MSGDLQADFVIVGAGSGGCAVAGRLAEAGYEVLLLEAGPASAGMASRIPAAWPKLFKSAVDWDYCTTPQRELDGRQIYWPRGRMLGGSSAMNAQMYLRGAMQDFDGWAAAGCEGWDYASLLPAFRAAECNARGADRFHGADGPLHVADAADPHPATAAFVEACREVGIPVSDDFNGATIEGAGRVQVNQRNSRRWSAADAYLGKRRNLRVLTDALATRVIFEGRRAAGVEFVQRGQRARALGGREIVLAGGAVNSPQLLMLSGVGPAGELRRHGITVLHELAGVGANLQDHPVTPVWARMRRAESLLAAEAPTQLLRYLLQRRGMLSSNVGEACAFVRSDPALPMPDVELIFAPVLFQGEGLVKPSEHGITIGAGVLAPESRGRLRLASADPRAKPVIDPAYLSDARDRRTLENAYAIAARVLNARALRGVVSGLMCPPPSDRAAVDAHIRRTTQTFYHPAGTCRMGRDPDSVVAPDLRVHGLEGLRIADASIMPRLVRGHPHAACVMIGEQAALHALAATRGLRRAA